MVDMWNGVATPKSGKTTASYFLSEWNKKVGDEKWRKMPCVNLQNVTVELGIRIDKHVLVTNLPTNILCSLTSFSLGTKEGCL